MDLTFGVLALLPLGLASFFSRELRRGAAAGFFQLLAPVIAMGVKKLIEHKQAKSAEKKQAAYDLQQSQAAEAARKAEFEAGQNSPQALAQRQKFTLQLGKLLGKAGGKEKVPPSIYNYLSSQRQAQAYTPGASYTPKPTSGAGFWDFAGGLGNALSYLDTTKIGKGKAPMSPGQPVGQTFQTGQLSQLLRPKDPRFASGTQDFG